MTKDIERSIVEISTCGISFRQDWTSIEKFRQRGRDDKACLNGYSVHPSWTLKQRVAYQEGYDE